MRTSVREAVKFHGHLGPWLILGVLMGEEAMKRLKAKKYFGINVEVSGLDKKPKSCFIDGLQLSTGATYGKGNIRKILHRKIRVVFRNPKNRKRICSGLKQDLLHKLEALSGHKESEDFARGLAGIKAQELFNFR